MQAGLGIDKYFLDKAKDTKRVEQLETAEGQIRLLSDIPPDLEEKYLSVSLDQAKKYQELGTTMQSAWIDGDADKMDAFLSRWFSEPAAIAKKLREDRNPHMAEVAETYLKKKEPCFMVVGAAHLVGKEGVIRLLQKKGYKVEQVTAAPRQGNKSMTSLPQQQVETTQQNENGRRGDQSASLLRAISLPW